MYLSRPKFWRKINIISLLLIPLSILYFFIITFKKLTSKKAMKVKPFVICVGNVTIGGTGKTPLCIELGKFLKSHDFNIAYLTRGFGGDGSYIGKVDKDIHSAVDVGDEAIMLSKVGSTYVGKNRFMAAKLAEMEGVDVIIMDDGMQHNSLHKDINLLVFDSEYLFGNRLLLPAGPLREPISWALKKADFLVCTASGKASDTYHLESELGRAFSIEYSVVNIDEIKGRKFIALSSIADPEKFLRTAEKSGAEILELISYPDHYIYNEKEIQDALHKAVIQNCKILTTAKDAVKIPEKYFYDIVVLDLFLKDNQDLKGHILSIITKALGKD